MVAAATATRNKPAASHNGQQQSAEALAPLWGNDPDGNPVEIQVIVGTGEFSTGKTLFGLLIDHAHCRLWDSEGSAATYKNVLGNPAEDYVDMARVLRTKFGNKTYTSLDRFKLWKEDVEKNCPPGRYRVGIIDPASEIEDGIVQYVEANPSEFGYTANQFAKSAAMKWGAVKSYWKALLDDLRVRFDTIYLTVHMRNEFVGNTPTGKREPKGKETLFELASLYLEFQRKPDKKGAVPQEPAAIVLKERLNRMVFVDGKLTPIRILPPRIPVCTPDTIRAYIANPVGEKLSAAERYVEEGVDEATKLALEAMIAADRRAASEAELARMDRAEKARERAMPQASQSQPADQSHKESAKRETKAAASAMEYERSNAAPCGDEQIEKIVSLFEKLEVTPEQAAAILQAAGAARISSMSTRDADDLIAALTAKLSGREAEAAFGGGPQEQPAETPVAETNPAEQQTEKLSLAMRGTASDEQLEEIKTLLERLTADMEVWDAAEQMKAIARKYGHDTFRQFSCEEAERLIPQLQAMDVNENTIPATEPAAAEQKGGRAKKKK